MRKIRTPLERILARVDSLDPEQCWRWLGATSPSGYGQVTRTNLRKDGTVYIHRAVYEAVVGPIPEGMVIDHLCRVRNCVNPLHLEPVTNAENVMRGESHIASNPAKTHCPKGHPYDAENTYHYKGARQCRQCRNIHREAWRARSKAGESVALSRESVRA